MYVSCEAHVNLYSHYIFCFIDSGETGQHFKQYFCCTACSSQWLQFFFCFSVSALGQSLLRPSAMIELTSTAAGQKPTDYNPGPLVNCTVGRTIMVYSVCITSVCVCAFVTSPNQVRQIGSLYFLSTTPLPRHIAYSKCINYKL